MLNFCRKRRLLSGLLVGSLFFLLTYLAYGHYLGQMTEEVMLSAFAERGYVENNKYSNMISDENYNYMVISGRFDEPQTPLYITQKRPFVVHWFCGAYVGIKFNFSYGEGKTMASYEDITMNFILKLQNGQCYITNVEEGPRGGGG